MCHFLSFADFTSIITPVVMSGVFPNFVPVVDGSMVPIHPRDSIASGASKNHDLMTGFTHHDGAGLVYLNPLGRATNYKNQAVNVSRGGSFVGREASHPEAMDRLSII